MSSIAELLSNRRLRFRSCAKRSGRSQIAIAGTDWAAIRQRRRVLRGGDTLVAMTWRTGFRLVLFAVRSKAIRRRANRGCRDGRAPGQESAF